MIYTFGSINADHVYRLSRLPAPGETLTADTYIRVLGGKGANQSIAAVRAGASVVHIGAVGHDGDWMRRTLATEGVNVDHLITLDTVSGHAVVMVDACGENAIVIHPGANRRVPVPLIEAALGDARPGDWLLMQNETSGQVEAAQRARALGLHVAYSAAPFDVAAVRAVLPFVSLLILNAIEAGQLLKKLGAVDVPMMLVTRGAKGAELFNATSDETLFVPAFSVTAIDTTGAGDCFAGYAVASLAAGLAPAKALRRASAAAALQVQHPGASAAIPTAAEVDDFLAAQD
jgi:ribokinase